MTSMNYRGVWNRDSDEVEGWTRVALALHEHPVSVLENWCRANCVGRFALYTASNVFYFTDPKDAVLFKLRWV